MSTFKFLPDDTPQQQLFTDVQNLNSFPEDRFSAFLKIAFAFIALKEDSQDMLDKFCQDHKVSPKSTGALMQSMLYFLSECLKLSLKPEDVKKDLIALGLSDTHTALAVKIYQQEFANLSGALIDNTFKVNRLMNIEWKFGVTAATSELAEVGTCFLQLKLALDKNGTVENVVFELSLPQFYAFVSSMQQAAAEIQGL
jgi:hypothetical protein